MITTRMLTKEKIISAAAVIVFLLVQRSMSFAFESDIDFSRPTTFATTSKEEHTVSPTPSGNYKTTGKLQGDTPSTQTPKGFGPDFNVDDSRNNTNRTYSTLLLDVISPHCADSECNAKSYCSCDNACYHFLDCCHGQIQKDFADVSSSLKTSIAKMLNDRRTKAYHELNARYKGHLDQFGCVTETDGTYGYWMIEKCPLTFIGDPDIRGKCENANGYNFNSIPIDIFSDGGAYHATFKNIYCALCSGVNLTNFVFWKLIVKCQEDYNGTITVDTPLSDIERECDISYGSLYAEFIRTCHPVVKTFRNHLSIPINHGDNTAQDFKHLCEFYIMPISEILYFGVNGSDIYRNPHCAFMDNIANIKDYYCVFIDQQRAGTLYFSGINIDKAGGQYTNQISLRILFDFDATSGVELVSSCDQRESCEMYDLFDCVSSRCRRLYCLESFIPYFGKCIPPIDNTTLTNDPSVPVDTSQLAAEFNDTYLIITIAGPVERLLELQNETGKLLILDAFGSTLNSGAVMQLITKTKAGTVVYYVSVDADFIAAYDVVKKLYKMIKNDLYKVIVQNFETTKSLSCNNNKTSLMAVDDLAYSNYPDIASIYFPSLNRSVASKHVRWQIINTENGVKLGLVTSCLPINTLVNLKCPFVKVNTSGVEFDGDTLLISDHIFRIDEYVRFQNDLYVCSTSLGTTLTYINVFEYMSDYIVLTYITSSVSIVCVLIIICINVIDRKHMNIHSLNITALSLTVLFIHALIVIQASLHEGIICIIYAVALHFFVLNMFVWINIIAFDMTRVFTSPFSITNIKPYRKFLKYVIASVLLPFTFIMTGLCLQFSPLVQDDNTLIKPGYGENGICWLSRGLSIVVYVIVPISLSMVITFVLYTVSVVAMCRQREETKQVGKMTLADYLFVYIKLVFILGFTWALGVISAVSHQEWLWVLNAVLNGLQGFSLLICSVVNKRVIRRLRGYIDNGISTKTRSDTVSKETDTDLTQIHKESDY